VEINDTKVLRAILRAGPYAWPGGYPLYFITSDGGVLSFDAVRKEYRRVSHEVRHPSRHDQFRVMAVEINYEDPGLICDHTNERIPSAYAEDEVQA
jgi:hypothetical protein